MTRGSLSQLLQLNIRKQKVCNTFQQCGPGKTLPLSWPSAPSTTIHISPALTDTAFLFPRAVPLHVQATSHVKWFPGYSSLPWSSRQLALRFCIMDDWISLRASQPWLIMPRTRHEKRISANRDNAPASLTLLSSLMSLQTQQKPYFKTEHQLQPWMTMSY